MYEYIFIEYTDDDDDDHDDDDDDLKSNKSAIIQQRKLETVKHETQRCEYGRSKVVYRKVEFGIN